MYQAPPPMMLPRDRKHQLPGRGLTTGIFTGILTSLIYTLLLGAGLTIFASTNPSLSLRLNYIIVGIIIGFIIVAIPSSVIGAVTGWLMGRKLSQHPGVPTRKQVFVWALILSGTITFGGSSIYILYLKVLQQKGWSETFVSYLFFLGIPSVLYIIACCIMSLCLRRWSLQAHQPTNYRPPHNM